MSNVIKRYTQWVNEAESTAPTPTGPAVDAVTFISASSSASNITPNLAAKLGVEANKLYTFQLRTLSLLAKIYADGKFMGDGAKASGVVIDPAQAVATKPGEDILELNGKRITEAGSIIFTKAELTGPITVKASNNGLLTLIRMGEALSTMGGTYKNYLGTSKEWSAKFSMGGNVAEKDSRGFSFWYAKPGELGPDSNLLAMIIAMAALKAAGHEERIAVNDPVTGSWYNSTIKDKTPQESIAKITDILSKSLAKRMMLTQNPAGDTSAVWTVKDYKPLMNVPQEWAKTKVKITDVGAKTLSAMMDGLVKAITPTAPPAGFGAESQGVLTAYAELIKSGLLTKKNQVGYWFESVQEVKDWQTGTARPGSSGTGGASQGEGQFGQPKPTQGNTPQK